MTALPGVLQEIAEVVGEEAALAIAAARGGTQVYIPPVPPSDHWLCKLIGVSGPALAAELTMGIKGLRLELPLGPTGHAAQVRARVDAMIKAGASNVTLLWPRATPSEPFGGAALATDTDAAANSPCSDLILAAPDSCPGRAMARAAKTAA
jgi:hypothetical protein